MKRFFINLSCTLLTCVFPLVTNAEVILHAFNWKYSDVTNNATEIANIGYKKVLIAPALKSSGEKWYFRYQPQDLRVIDSPLGNKQDLEDMIKALDSVGVSVYADVVFNHMANESVENPELNYPNQTVLADYANRSEYFERQKLFGNLSTGEFSSKDFNPYECIDWGKKSFTY